MTPVVRPVFTAFSERRKSPPREVRARGREIRWNRFPAACTWEKHFTRSERRIVRHRRAAEALSEAVPFLKKVAAPPF